MKKLIRFMLASAFFLLLFQVSTRAIGDEIIFSPDVQTNIVLVNSTVVTETIVSGVKAYSVNTGQSLRFNINDSVIYQNPDFYNVEIDVSYYDTGCGWFSIKYDSESNSEMTYNDYVELYNTNTIIKKTIRLEDAYFGNRCASGTSDFIINVPNSEYGKALNIISIEVRVLPSKSCIKIDAQSGVYGNIFFDDNNRIFSVKYSNKSSNAISFNAYYEIKSNDKTVTYHSETKSLNVSSDSSVVDNYTLSAVNQYDTYMLYITVSDSTELYESVLEVPFSFCVGSKYGGVNSRIGINGHFNTGKESQNGMEILRKAGFGSVREGYYWANFEAQKGIYSETANITECYTNAEANNMDILVLAAYSNTNYCETDRHIPATDEEREGFANYVYEMLGARNGNVSVVEIWNEPNLEKFNANNLGQEDYVRLLKAVYEKIKPEYPDVQIGAPAISNVQYISSWLPDMLASDIDGDGSYDAYKYFDIVTIHHYRGTNATRLAGVVNDISPLFDYLAQYGCADKKVYHTEFGLGSMVTQYNPNTEQGTMYEVGEERQAELLSQYYLLIHGNNSGEKFYIYQFSNNGIIENLSTNSYGLVKADNYRVPYAAKPGLLAMANINNLLKYTDATEVVQSGNINVLKYTCADLDKEVYAFFTFAGNETYVFTPGWDNAEFYDMYGNRLNIPLVGGNYTLNISESPVYAGKNTDTHRTVLFTRNGGNIIATGIFAGAKAGDYVGIKVFDKSNNLVSIGQVVLDDSKQFTFEFTPLSLNSELTVQFGTKSFNEVYILDLNADELKRSAVRVYVNEVPASSLCDIAEAETVQIKVDIYDETITDFSLVCASFEEKTLKDVLVIKMKDMNVVGNTYSTSLSTSTFDDAERVAMLLLDTLDRIIPLTEALGFN